MASKERIQRLKDETRRRILEAAFKVVREQGWQGFSLRKVADVIEYSAPIIYEYFYNKKALLLELTRLGFAMLSREIQIAKDEKGLPAEQLKNMWLAYWQFAFSEKELYQIMFGVEMNCCGPQQVFLEADRPYRLFANVIAQLMGNQDVMEDEVLRHFYTLWSVVHGLVSINMVGKGRSDEINHQVLESAIEGIIISIHP